MECFLQEAAQYAREHTETETHYSVLYSKSLQLWCWTKANTAYDPMTMYMSKESVDKFIVWLNKHAPTGVKS